jgi:hypothetical protein
VRLVSTIVETGSTVGVVIGIVSTVKLAVRGMSSVQVAVDRMAALTRGVRAARRVKNATKVEANLVGTTSRVVI